MGAQIIQFPERGEQEKLPTLEVDDPTPDPEPEDVIPFADVDGERLLYGPEEEALDYLRSILSSDSHDQMIAFRGPIFHVQPDGSCMCIRCRRGVDVLHGCEVCHGEGCEGRYETPISILEKWRALAEMYPQLRTNLNPIDMIEEMYHRSGAPVPPMCTFAGNDGRMYGVWTNGIVARTREPVTDVSDLYSWVKYESWENIDVRVCVAGDADVTLSPWLTEDATFDVEIYDEGDSQENGSRMSFQKWVDSYVGAGDPVSIRFTKPSEGIEGVRRWNALYPLRQQPLEQYFTPMFYDVNFLLDITDEGSLNVALMSEGLEIDQEGGFICTSCSRMVHISCGCYECEERGDSPPLLNPQKLVSWARRQYEAGFYIAIDELPGLFVERSGEVESPVACFVDERGSMLLVFANRYASVYRRAGGEFMRPSASDLETWHSIVQYPLHHEDEVLGIHDNGRIVVFSREIREDGGLPKSLSLQEFTKLYGVVASPIEWDQRSVQWWPEEAFDQEDSVLVMLLLDEMDPVALEKFLRDRIPEMDETLFWLEQGLEVKGSKPFCTACSREFDIMSGCSCDGKKQGVVRYTVNFFIEMVRRAMADDEGSETVTDEILIEGLKERIGRPVL